MPTLFEIGDDLLALDQLLLEIDFDITDPRVDEAISEWFAEATRNESSKIDGYINLIRRNEAQAAACREEAERYAKAANSKASAADRLKDRLRYYLESTGRKSLTTATGRTVSVQANGGATPIVYDEAIDTDNIPDDFAIVRRIINTAAVASALKHGRSVPFARLGERGTHLRIR